MIALACLRCVYPSVADDRPLAGGNSAAESADMDSLVVADTIMPVQVRAAANVKSRFFTADGSQTKNRIYSVPHFGNTFPDQNDVQLVAAHRHGVKPVTDRADAEKRKSELVYVGGNPF